MMKIVDGWCESARWVPSPNCDQRPAGTTIDMIVVHGISLPPGEYGGGCIEALFTNSLDANAHPYFREICDLQVSAHVLIERNGEVLQFVPFGQRAWHAGESCFEGRTRCNDFSIGIELEGADDQPYESVQYQRLAELIRGLMEEYPAITGERIVAHSTIAPGRKTDPGPAFDWDRLYTLLGHAE